MLQLTHLPSDILIQIASLLSNNDSTSTASPFSYMFYSRTFAPPTPTERLIFAGVLNNLDTYFAEGASKTARKDNFTFKHFINHCTPMD